MNPLSPRNLIRALVFAVLASGQAAAQNPTFNTIVTTPANTGSLFPEHGTVGDLNGDGKLDAVLTDGQSALRVMIGNGDGSFTERDRGLPQITLANTVNLHPSLTAHLPVSVGGFGALQAADVNLDGRLDLVSIETAGVNFTNYSFIGVLINMGNDLTGTPLFSATHHWVPFLGVRPVTVGDLNGDGAPDLAIGSCCGAVQVWLNNGSGVFSAGQITGLTPGAGGPSVGEGAIADLNGDGKADYVATSNQNGGANIFFGNGNGTLQTPATYLPNHGVSVEVTDANNDGSPDLLMGNGTPGSEGLLVYLNNGAGAFTSTLYPIAGFGGGFNGNGSVAVADVNGDGKQDAVLSAYDGANNTHRAAVLLADGSGGFGAPIMFSAPFVPTHVFVGDFTNDAKPDIGVVLRNSRSFGVLTNTTVFTPPLPTRTLTILGGDGAPGGIAANVEYYNPATGIWQAAYLSGWHPWGFVPGTNSWINYRVGNGSDAGAGPTKNQTLWYLYRVRFTVPADAINPKMTFSLKADNFAQVAINGATAGGSNHFINNAWMSNVVEGTADQVNVDAAFAQNVHVGENTITLKIGDWGGLNGFNFRIDLSMQSSEDIEIVPVDPDTDGDGVPDDQDAFPNDPSETTDTDGDGTGDNADAFDHDASETTDTDGDGVGDNADAFDNDASETTDTDGDGVGNNADAFDNDPTETRDSDADGVGDTGDAFPNDPSETKDSDGDGVGDNADAYPNSNLSPNVTVGACVTGVWNLMQPNGASLNDLIGSALSGGANHGAKVSAVSALSNGWKSSGLISGRDHGAIVSCVARSK